MTRLCVGARLIGILAWCAAAGCSATGRSSFMDRGDDRAVRLVSYNAYWDAMFPDDDPNNHPWRKHARISEFERVMKALQPDILCLQEINPKRDPADICAILDRAIPLAGGARWYGVIGNDNVIASRYPIVISASRTAPPGDREQAIALVDLPDDRYAADLYIMNEHYECCGGEEKQRRRQQQSDSIVSWLRDARDPGGHVHLPFNTPFVIVGDLNLVGGPQPLDTLVSGDISDEDRYGPDSPPDWDGSALADLHPLHNGRGPDDYTWRDDTMEYAPGRLDYILYTDSCMSAVRKFVLNTMTLSEAELNAAGLERFDVVFNPPGGYDHFPLVVDFVLNED